MDAHTTLVHQANVNEMESRNYNNNSNQRQDIEPIYTGSQKAECGTGVLDDIHPEITQEGYGLRTPYGTHFNLDFLKYCQNIAQGPSYIDYSNYQHRKSSTSSSNNSLNSTEPKQTESERIPPPEVKTSPSSSLFETRRRLDAFRSFRKKRSNAAEERNKFIQLTDFSSGESSAPSQTDSPKTHETNAANDSSGLLSPGLSTLLNTPLSQQNLHMVREQMAAALARLKHLENEVKQIPVLQVQISVLQQEKQKLYVQIKKCKEGISKDSDIQYSSENNSQSIGDTMSFKSGTCIQKSLQLNTSLPPPPPKRKYKSVAVGNDNAENDTLKMKMKDCGTSTDEECRIYKNIGVTVNAEMYDAACETTQANKISACTSTTITSEYSDVVTVDASCGVNYPVFYQDAEAMTLTTSTIDSGCQVDKFQMLKIADASCGPCGLTFYQNKETMTYIDTAGIGCQTIDLGMEDKEMMTQNTYVIKFPENCVDACVGDDQVVPETVSINCATATDEVLIHTQGVNTVSVAHFDKASNFRPNVLDFACNVEIKPATSTVATSTLPVQTLESQTTNTETIVQVNATTQSQVLSCDASEYADIRPVMTDAFAVTDNVEYQDVATMCLMDELIKSAPNHASEMLNKEMRNNEMKENDMNRCTVDVATDTNDLDDEPSTTDILKDEIGTYVGQVESLLEEQQSLLADKYKELEDVLDDRDDSNVSFVTPVKTLMWNSPLEERKSTQLAVVLPKYQLSTELRSSCLVIDQHLKGLDISQIDVESANILMQNKWFALSSHPNSDPESTRDFIFKLREVSLLATRVVVNLVDSSSNSALHYAVSHKNFGLVCMLAGIEELDINQFNNAGYTASMLAAITQVETEFEVHVLDILFQRANVNLHAKQAGQTALMLAVSHGCIPATRSLLNAGADINSQDEDGSTALMCATEHRHVELVKVLLAHPKCDPSITDSDGSSALSIAMETGQRDVAVLLYTQLKLGKDA